MDFRNDEMKNIKTLADEQLTQRAVDRYKSRKQYINHQQPIQLLTAVYFADTEDILWKWQGIDICQYEDY